MFNKVTYISLSCLSYGSIDIVIKNFELICNIYDIPSSSAGLSQLGVSEMEASPPPPHNGIHYFLTIAG